MGGGNISVLKTIPVKQIPLLLLKKRHEMTKKNNGIAAKHNRYYLMYQQWFSCKNHPCKKQVP